jgi:hypothetical protein
MFKNKSILTITLVSLFLLGGGKCSAPQSIDPDKPISDDPVSLVISFEKTPKLLKIGDKIKANLEGYTGNVRYSWGVDNEKPDYNASQDRNEYTIPNLFTNGECDVNPQITVVAETAEGIKVKTSLKVNVSRVWCQYGEGMKNQKITALALGPQKKVWVGTMDGLWHFNSADAAVLPQNIKQSSNGLLSNRIKALLVKENDVWIGTDFGAQRLTLDDKLFPSNWSEYTVRTGFLQNDIVHSLALTKAGNVLIGTNDGANEINPADDKKAEVANYFPGQYIKAIAVNSDAEWFGAGSGRFQSGFGIGLRIIEPGIVTVPVSEVIIDGTQWSDHRANVDVTTIALSGENAYVGLYHYGQSVGSGNIRGGMVRARIFEYPKDKVPLKAEWKHFKKEDHPNMPGNDIRKIVRGEKKFNIRSDGKKPDISPMWVATATGLGRFEPILDGKNNGVWKTFSQDELGNSLPTDITDLAYDSLTKILWIGTNGSGLFRLRASLLDE